MNKSLITKSIKGVGFAAALAFGVMTFAGTSNAQYYPNQGPYYGGNARYDRNEQKRAENAYKKGFKDGERQGKRDARSGHRSNVSYRNGGSIFGGIFSGRNGREQSAYQDGFQRGYQSAYDRNYRDRRYNTGRSWPF